MVSSARLFSAHMTHSLIHGAGYYRFLYDPICVLSILDLEYDCASQWTSGFNNSGSSTTGRSGGQPCPCVPTIGSSGSCRCSKDPFVKYIAMAISPGFGKDDHSIAMFDGGHYTQTKIQRSAILSMNDGGRACASARSISMGAAIMATSSQSLRLAMPTAHVSCFIS